MQALDDILKQLEMVDSPGQSASGNLSSSQPPSGSVSILMCTYVSRKFTTCMCIKINHFLMMNILHLLIRL